MNMQRFAYVCKALSHGNGFHLVATTSQASNMDAQHTLSCLDKWSGLSSGQCHSKVTMHTLTRHYQLNQLET